MNIFSFKILSKLKISSAILLYFSFNLSLFAQQEGAQDTLKTGFSVGKLKQQNPKSILEAYTYDPVTNRYIYTETFEGFNINYPIILTPKEYEELVLKESMHNYFKEKSDAIDGKKGGTQDQRRNLLPIYYVNSGLFETIFGGNTIDIRPTGSVEMDIGLAYIKQDNPSFSPRARKNTTFDFNQRISLGLMGKVGTKLEVNINYDTQSTFSFQNIMKLEYEPTEDAIIRKVEVGNVDLPLSSSLIRGAQSLFGVKTQFQFGKTTVTGVFSDQRSQTKNVTAQGGGAVQDFDLFALDYDTDRHFFLSQYFRNKYDDALANYPYINSRVQIIRIEVWLTNRQNRINTADNNLRNIIALQDLGEERSSRVDVSQIIGLRNIPVGFFTGQVDRPATNANNKFNPALINNGGLLNSNIREIATASTGFVGVQVSEGVDYSKLENARKLTASEYTYHPQLGYISLNQRLGNDEILAVAYQYTVGGQVYQVGEFGTDGVEGTVVDNGGKENQTVRTQSLILKLLKSSITNVNEPKWNLMMKNIYQIPGGYQLERDGFRFNIVYSDPSQLNYITSVAGTQLPDNVANTPLLNVFNLDRLNYNNDPQNRGDGFFDFIPGLTVDVQNGRIIFTTIEPFGSHLFKKLSAAAGEDYNITSSYNPNQKKYVFREMYTNTQIAALQDAGKNKFELKGKFKSTSGDGIAIGAFNIPKGSVVVTAGGRVLLEGVDYTVNYQLGRVQILDPSLQASNTPIQISVENNSVFGQQTKRFMGINVEHKLSDNFLVGGTFLRLTERPLTQKANYNQESVMNSIFGFNTNFSTEVPFFTRLVNKLPNVDTDVPSNFSLRGEVAFLKPDAPKVNQFEGEATVYIDDFEGSQTPLDMHSALAWSLASAPIGYGGEKSDSDLESGYRRAKLSWYTVDPIFYTGARPSGITTTDLSYNRTRRVYQSELFPVKDILVGQSTVVPTLDLTYYPQERGPYNFNPLSNGNELPAVSVGDNWGGIMRAINTTDFEQANVEYIQLWVMDPYFGNDNDPDNSAGSSSQGGKLVFNLGQISEDVLKDGRKFYENGLPAGESGQTTINTQWGKVPASQSLIYAFDSNERNRASQDLGLDGLTDAEEAQSFPQFAGLEDPAGDNYQFFGSGSGGVLERYKNYNGLQGNSPVNITNNNRGSTTLPDVEDINRDNTMNTINAYYKYSIDINPSMAIGDQYVTDVRLTSTTTPNNQTVQTRWIQFKIPIMEITSDNIEGGINDFRSIQFMRMFMTGFKEQTTLRLGALDLVRGEWIRYTGVLDPEDQNQDNDNTGFDVLAVNLEENGNRVPIPYVMPPGVTREQIVDQHTIINLDEQSLSLRITKKDLSVPGLGGLEPKDSRGVFKLLNVDMRQYSSLRMFLHAESLPLMSTAVPNGETSPLLDDQMVAFIRFGNDFTKNFYQVEIPLKITAEGATLDTDIWPEANNVDLKLSLLTQLKVLAMNIDPSTLPADGIFYRYEDELDNSLTNKQNKLRIGIKGNPNFGFVRNMMLGVKNVYNREIRGEVWFNELRIAGMDQRGGMAAVVDVDTNFADFAAITATGRMSTIGFGSIEQRANERSIEDMKQYNIVTNLNIGKLLPKKWGINLPFNYGIGEEIITPEFDPFYEDIRLRQLLDGTTDRIKRDNIKDRAINYTKTKSINFIGVRKDRAPEQKNRIYDPENLTLSYSFNQIEHHDFEVENQLDQNLRTAVDYNYSFEPNSVEPFKGTKFLQKSGYWKLLSDFNFNYLPSSVTFNSNILRQFNRQQFRQVDVEGIGLNPLFRRDYRFNYQYGFNYNLSKSLRFNYTASTSNIVTNYLDENGDPMDSFTIWNDYWNIGDPNQHMQQLVMNYDIPINKIPVLAFVKATYSYTSDYNWQRGSLVMSNVMIDDVSYNLGNIIQNANSHRLNTSFNMDIFYKYIGLTKRKTPTRGPINTNVQPLPGQKIGNNTTQQNNNEQNVFLDGLIGVATSIKNIQINYTENNGTLLPGYLPKIGFLGSSRPSLGFVFGSQSDVRYGAAKNGWLTNYPEFNENFTQTTNKTLNLMAQIDLFPDLKIDLSADRAYSENFSEQYDVTDGIYNSRAPNSFGNYSISTVLIRTAFSKSDESSSVTFDNFRNNRAIIANRLAIEHYGTLDYPVDEEGYPVGFGKNSQSVLLPSFLAAYSGSDASNTSLGIFKSIPIPNWSIKYTGLMRYKYFKDTFKRFSLQHDYRASYTINQFISSLDHDQNPNGLDTGGNFFPETIISNINLVEQFNPLLRVDFEMKNSFKVLAELRKERALSISFDNNLLTEVKGIEYIIGLGYRIKDVVITSVLADNPTNTIKSDINIRGDISLRKNETTIRNLDYDNNQLAGGQNIWSLKITADYSFTRNLTAIFYYDHSFADAVISTAFPMTNIRAGFTLRYSFGN